MISPSPEHSILIKEANMCFVYIPKTACTSWKLFIWKILGNEILPELTYKDVHNQRVIELPYIDRMDEAAKKEHYETIRNKEMKITAIIREPKARVLSAYLDKIYNHKNPRSSFSTSIIPEIQKFHGLEKGVKPSFKEFLQWNIEISKDRILNDHWRPSHEIIGINTKDDLMDKNISLFTMNNQQALVDLINSRTGQMIKFPKKDELGKRPVNESERKLEAYYQEEECKLFEMIYKKDIELYKVLTVMEKELVKEGLTNRK